MGHGSAPALALLTALYLSGPAISFTGLSLLPSHHVLQFSKSKAYSQADVLQPHSVSTWGPLSTLALTALGSPPHASQALQHHGSHARGTFFPTHDFLLHHSTITHLIM